MTYIKIKSREEMTGCTCGSMEPLTVNSPVTGFTCPACGATKDKYKEALAEVARLKAALRAAEDAVCFSCKLGRPLEYHPGEGWYHSNTDGGPDIECRTPSVIALPNPEGEE